MKALIAAPAAIILLSTPTMAEAPPFDTPATVAFMKDLSSGAVLYAKNPDQRVPPASLAKTMTVYVVFDMIKHGDVKLDQMITFRPDTWKKWHSQGSTMFISPNESISVANLLYGIITLSGNDACVDLAEGVSGTEAAFVQRMNAEAKKLGMTNSHFGTSNGWPDEGVTYVTARDMVTLATATIQNFPKLYKQFYAKPDFTWGQTMGGEAITQENRDPLLGRVAGADGLKTGHTEESGYSVVGSAEQDGRRLVMMMSGMQSFNQRIEQSVAFMNWGFRAWQARPIVAKGKLVEKAAVQGGDSSTVALVAPEDIKVTVPSGSSPDMQIKVVYQGPIQAPIKAGDHVADLVVTTPDTGAQTMPLVAANDVGKAGFFRRAWNGLLSLL
ncbi:MAG TPA: D-alanyl-D-alanine carboxypeptidase family protein [Sphingomonas sp.]|nr:D-alanyl-D-alanine carboxypeptidase family protein [Sphingomonas sp.]